MRRTTQVIYADVYSKGMFLMRLIGVKLLIEPLLPKLPPLLPGVIVILDTATYPPS